MIRTFKGHSDRINTIKMLPDGEHFISAAGDPRARRTVSGSYDHTLKLWNLETGTLIHTFEGHTDAVNEVAITRDGKRVVSVSQDHSLKLWNIDSGSLIATFYGDAEISCVSVVNDELFVAGSSDGAVHFLKLQE